MTTQFGITGRSRSATAPASFLSSRLLLFPTALGLSHGATFVQDQIKAMVGPVDSTALHADTALYSQFTLLMEEWDRDTSLSSSLGEIYAHPALQRIIGMGRRALPWILEDLKTSDRFWFSALREIAKHDPCLEEDAGDFARMRDRWIEWGASNGIIS